MLFDSKQEAKRFCRYENKRQERRAKNRTNSNPRFLFKVEKVPSNDIADAIVMGMRYRVRILDGTTKEFLGYYDEELGNPMYLRLGKKEYNHKMFGVCSYSYLD